MRPTFDLSISIVTFGFDRPLFREVLARLVTAVERAQLAGVAERACLHLIDNGEDADELRALLESVLGNRFPWSLVATGRNLGFGRAHNEGIRRADSEFHLVMNPDVLLDPDALTQGLTYLREHPRICAVGPHARTGMGEPAYLCKRLPSVMDLALRGFAPAPFQRRFERRLAHYEYRDLPEDRPSPGIQLLSGCCLLARSKQLQEIGGFDEGYFLYFEDFDLCLRLRALGQLAHVPAMQVTHFGGDASRKGLRHILLFVRSAIRFFHSHGWRWA